MMKKNEALNILVKDLKGFVIKMGDIYEEYKARQAARTFREGKPKFYNTIKDSTFNDQIEDAYKHLEKAFEKEGVSDHVIYTIKKIKPQKDVPRGNDTVDRTANVYVDKELWKKPNNFVMGDTIIIKKPDGANQIKEDLYGMEGVSERDVKTYSNDLKDPVSKMVTKGNFFLPTTSPAFDTDKVHVANLYELGQRMKGIRPEVVRTAYWENLAPMKVLPEFSTELIGRLNDTDEMWWPQRENLKVEGLKKFVNSNKTSVESMNKIKTNITLYISKAKGATRERNGRSKRGDHLVRASSNRTATKAVKWKKMVQVY